MNAVENPAYDVVAISGPRGLGKTFLAGHVLSRALTPGDSLNEPGKEYVLGAGSLDMARMTFGFIRAEREPKGGYRWIDSTTRLGATHVSTNTKLRAISSNAKTSFGLVNVPIVCLDEPGSLEIRGGEMLADSLFSAQGKVGSRLKLILCGTLAPGATGAGHWWFDLVTKGTTGSTFVMKFQGDASKWDQWPTIRKANPLVSVSASFRKKLLQERDAARRDSRLKARFLSYRLNIPSGDSATMLLTTEDWQRVVARPVPPREGRPVVAYDLGGGRSFSAATALYENGRTEALALAPGIPSLEDQEKRDRVPAGLYRRLESGGRLIIAEGRRVQPPGTLHDYARDQWGPAQVVICDRFRVNELRDVVIDTPLIPRVSRWSESSFDIRALRKFAADGPLSVTPDSRSLLLASLSVSQVKNDDSGNFRLQKKGSNNCSRDDISAAWVLAAGALDRRLRTKRPPLKWAVL